jgi:transposase-like protein
MKKTNKKSRKEVVTPTKITFAEWENAVREARSYLSNWTKARWKIVNIALRVCDVSKGGRKHENTYTLKRFANDIDINEHTLYEWVRCRHNVLDKLPKMIVRNIEAGHVEHKLVTDVLSKISADANKKEVLGYYMEMAGMEPETRKFQKYDQHLRALLYNAQRPLQMKFANEEILKAMIQKCEAIAAMFKKELELRKKFSADDRQNVQLKIRKNALNELNHNNESGDEHVIR